MEVSGSLSHLRFGTACLEVFELTPLGHYRLKRSRELKAKALNPASSSKGLFQNDAREESIGWREDSCQSESYPQINECLSQD